MTKEQVPLMVFHRTKKIVEVQIDWPMYVYADKFTGAVRARDVMNKAEWKREEDIYAAQGFWSNCLRFTESRPAEGFVALRIAPQLRPGILQAPTPLHHTPLRGRGGRPSVEAFEPPHQHELAIT